MTVLSITLALRHTLQATAHVPNLLAHLMLPALAVAILSAGMRFSFEQEHPALVIPSLLELWLGITLSANMARLAVLGPDDLENPGRAAWHLGRRELVVLVMNILVAAPFFVSLAVFGAIGAGSTNAGPAMGVLFALAVAGGAWVALRLSLAPVAAALDLPAPARVSWRTSNGIALKLFLLGLACTPVHLPWFLLQVTAPASVLAGMLAGILQVIAMTFSWLALGFAFRQIQDQADIATP